MRRHVHQRAIIMLAVDFHQQPAEVFQHLHAHRLVIDESLGAAVSQLHAAQDQHVLVGDVVLGEERPGGVIGLEVKRGDDAALLGPLAHQPGIAARAEREGKGVEQDRFARTGLAAQHRKASGKIDIQPVDENDVADR
jgi:hypothetical protein